MKWPNKITRGEMPSYIKEWKLAGYEIDFDHNGYSVESFDISNMVGVWSDDWCAAAYDMTPSGDWAAVEWADE